MVSPAALLPFIYLRLAVAAGSDRQVSRHSVQASGFLLSRHSLASFSLSHTRLWINSQCLHQASQQLWAQVCSDHRLPKTSPDQLVESASVAALLQLDSMAAAEEDLFVASRHPNILGVPPPGLAGTFGAVDQHHARTLIFGGCSADATPTQVRCSANLYAHSLDTNTWSCLDCQASLAKPSPRAGGSATPLGDDVYFFGGNAAGVLMNDLFVFHPNAQTWSRMLHA